MFSVIYRKYFIIHANKKKWIIIIIMKGMLPNVL